ncbi:MAG: helix-turn-helix domain-containing protein [bacterium]
MKQILTTTDVAKLLGLHVNTLKNWVRDGKLPSFRTIGGHYRIRVDELVAALREKGIPVPEALLETSRKDVFVVHPKDDERVEIERNLSAAGQLNVTCFDCGVEALMAMGRNMPAVIVWDAARKDVDVVTVLRSLRSKETAHRVDMVLIGSGDSLMNSGLPEEMSEVPLFTYPDNLPDMVKWMRRITD